MLARVMTSRAAPAIYDRLLRPLLFRLDPETAHRLSQFVLRREFPWSFFPSRDDGGRLAVKVGDWNLKSPIGLAAGFDKNGAAVPGLQHLGFDYLCVGSILPEPFAGNPPPRLLLYPDTESMVNCYGLPSDGLDVCVARLKRLAAGNLRTKLIANVHTESVTDYVRLCAGLTPYADGVELALRCPNRSDRLAIYPVAQLDELMATLRRQWPDKAMFVKLPPYANDQEKENRLELVERAIHFGLRGVTIPGNWTVPEPRLSRGQGSLSGRLTFAKNLETVRTMVAVTRGRIAIKASGGVHTGAEAFELLAAGATMIDILTAFVYRGWNAVAKIKSELLASMDERGVARVADLVPDQHGRSGSQGTC
jgi:dihydroorotate dehydrogenase (fumarate)/dihydroorotate dehydrogenase